ncbi:MAG: type II toxin-antitoxin system ParD family antitoxin [Myxococcota bacterium]|nr:type II toxin-antitoxin system ParD family antitoxin [Myxococcota bacterium]
MNITLNPELEQLIQSQLKTGKYKTAEQVLGEALRLLEESNRREAISQKVKDLFEKTQKIPGVQEITESEIATEISAYRTGE